MSIQCGVACLTCRATAPGVGDGGFLGAPLLAVAADCETSYERMPSFGYFYEALRGLGLKPYDLERFGEFLAQHDGHRLVLSSDHDDPDSLPEDLRSMEEEDTVDYMAELDALDAERDRRKASGEFSEATYEITCSRCAVSHSSSEPELLRAEPPLMIDPPAASVFVERWGRYPDDGWNHRLMGVADPYEKFMEELVEFAKTHGTHGLQARIRIVSGVA